MPENLQPPRLASRILSCFGSPHLSQILGDLMEEFNERAQTTGLPAARRWYWREVLRNIIALAGRDEMTGKARPRTLFLISGVWFGIALLCVWLSLRWLTGGVWFSHRWLMGIENHAWGIVTVVVFLAYLVLAIGWLVPMLWALISMNRRRLRSSSLIVFAVLVGVVLGVSGSSFYRANHPRVIGPMVYRPPSLRQIPAGTSDVVTVEVFVDSEGRVADYRVLPDAHGSRSVSHQIKDMLIYATFRPATCMDRPTNGTATLVFSRTGVNTAE